MLNQYGVSAVIKRAASTFTPGTGAMSGSPLSQTVKISPPKLETLPIPSGSTVAAREAVSVVAASDSGLTFEPKHGDYLELGGRSHEILSPVEAIRSGDSVAVYRIRWAG